MNKIMIFGLNRAIVFFSNIAIRLLVKQNHCLRGQKLHVLTSSNCSKSLDDGISTLQNLTCVTSVNNVIREMFEQKTCAGYEGKVVRTKNVLL